MFPLNPIQWVLLVKEAIGLIAYAKKMFRELKKETEKQK